MEIKELTQEDIVNISNLIVEYKSENGKSLSSGEIIKIKNLLKEIIDCKTSGALVAMEGNTFLGYICYHIYNFPLIIGKECYISDLVVSKRARGMGTGKELIITLENKVRLEKVTRLILNNPKESLSYKRSFYSKLGYIERDNFGNFIKLI